jgi:hypothetical protein
MDHAVLERIVAECLGGEAMSVVALEGGHSGAGVYRVRARFAGSERALVVKTAAVGDGPEDDEARIYGTHPRSLGATYALLQSRGIPTYELLGWGMPTAGVPVYWFAMSLLDGVSVHGGRPEDDAEGFQRMCGHALGAMHAVTRSFDGAADRSSPHPTSWVDGFSGAFEQVVRRELDLRGLSDLASRVRKFADRRHREWTEAPSYSLSHVDGLQGHAVHGLTGWRYLGHVDLEDVVFLDARFALAGYELAHGGIAPAPFWEAYESLVDADASYPAVRSVLQLYLLTDWLWIEESREQILATIAKAVARS